MAKYKVGDKVKIRKDLFVDESYPDTDHRKCYFTEEMKKVKDKYDYATIKSCSSLYDDRYQICEDDWGHWWTNEMFEESDRHKFERWMRQLARLDDGEKVWDAFTNLAFLKEDDINHEKTLKTVADYLFGEEKKKMTKAEIEAELGYKIEIVEEQYVKMMKGLGLNDAK